MTKTISDFVNGLSPDKVRNLATERMDYLANESAKQIIIMIWNRVFSGREDISSYKEDYARLKDDLQNMGLWASEFDVYYEDAINGRLTQEKREELTQLKPIKKYESEGV
ncbi:hypothetical protein HYT25_01020 [Candidatus Pacearchaeota archaeon]|nr:hypothetical protein [Candidatus Pacearchaeota archaeon]